MSTTPSAFAKYAAGADIDDTPANVEIVNRAGDPYRRQDGKAVVFLVVGEYSKEYRKGERRLLDKSLKRAERGGKLNAELVEAASAERAANGIVGWNLDDEAGKDVPFTRENVVAFLTAVPWVEEQVVEAIKGHARFFSRGSTS